MSLISRLKKAAGATLGDLRNRSYGTSGKRLSELSDGELEEEVIRRRRERARRRGGKLDRQAVSPQQKREEQWYANLELEPGASLDQVKRAYRELMRRYHPDKHLGDPERHKAATELAQSLTEAHRELSKHLGK
ncbi:MAG: hypothetical protein DRJ42_25000 [Deltaproteobacteria bacterium]|nr:MAG: hypothetical protein DRJ42_25000 [Deltaproteobacteria bacterium]